LAWNAVAYFLLGLVVMFTGGGVGRCLRGGELMTREGLAAYTADISGAKIHFLATGSSDAILLESDGHFALVDCAEDSDNPTGDPGLNLTGFEDYVRDYVKRVAAGADGKVVLDFILGTHAHSDHIGGFDTLLADPDITAEQAFLQRYTEEGMNETERGWDNEEVYQQMLDACAAKGIPVVQDMPAEPFALGAFTITILNSFSRDPRPRAAGENGNSLGVLAEAGGRRAFLAGDINWTDDGDEMLLCSQIGRVDLLKVGHHGYGGSTSIPFAAALRPKLAVFTNNFGSIPQETKTTLALFANSKLCCTGDFGGIVAVFGSEVALYAIGDAPRPSPWA
ncbi:MAG: MBL fold metallo-hydrolase, partial [Oscillospiraceae bacterium]|nr:MBL fold metallo-hydrolase [Oscillospiraceae bacterium]